MRQFMQKSRSKKQASSESTIIKSMTFIIAKYFVGIKGYIIFLVLLRYN